MTETWVACLTPPGRAGVASIGVRGPRAWSIARDLFRPIRGQLPEIPPKCKFWYGKIGVAQADTAILAVKDDAPATVELHCHGGVEAVRMIIELFTERGGTETGWQTFANDRDGLLAMLANAPTLRTASIMHDQRDGAWDRVIQQAGPALLQRLRELIPLGEHLVVPWKVVLAGAPNVGKSSLMNTLAGYTRSVVAPTAGTTRDVVSCRLAIDGWPIDLVDTAGLRESTEKLENLGIDRARTAISEADLRIWLVDGSGEPVWPDGQEDWLIVINKIDLPAKLSSDSSPSALRVSARTGEGLAELCEAISRHLVPTPPIPGEVVPWNDTQRLSLRLGELG